MSDNTIAIDILKSATDLIRAIEYDDSYYIEKNVSDIKSSLAQFEKVYYKNLATNGNYD